MTDSMKFGPEWLRNMSADTAASTSSNNSSSQITNSPGGLSSGGSSGDCTSNSYGNNSNSTNLNATGNNLHNVNSANTGALRNAFPEFRYGREEMLLLFDRNCGIPDILPSFKHLFVEKTQFPLALVPSTDEELMQGPVPSTQKPGWLQRSPVGFSTTSRGTSRVGCMERGRLRGKSIYHPVFQRPTAMFEDDQRSSTLKTERSWTERNGGTGGSDPTLSGNSTVGGVLGSSDAWNGNTPASSPRREFSNHPRNMENWRRSRNEDGSGGDASTNTSTFSAEGGWRLNSSGFQNSHSRWGRSTSWRDDDLSNNNDNSGISTGASGSGGMMLRSNSTIATTHGERLGPSVVSGSKQSISTAGSGVTRSISISRSKNTSAVNIWPNNSNIGQISNSQGDGGLMDDMALPEWAMENPSDIGGTFDASGAFLGSTIDDEENLVTDSVEKHSETTVQSQLSPSNKDKDNHVSKNNAPEKSSSQPPDNILLTKMLKENDNCQQESFPRSPTSLNVITSLDNSENLSESEKLKQSFSNTHNRSTISPNQENKESNNTPENEFNKESDKKSCATTISTTTVQTYQAGTTKNIDTSTNSCNPGDYAERMMKVTDDMIEKLIMDDEDSKDDHIKLTASKKRNSQQAFVTSLQQSQSSIHQPSSVSPVLGPGGAVATGPPNMGLYNMGGIVVDHTHNMAALHQLQQQQMAAVAAAAISLQSTQPPTTHPMTSSSPTDLWLYRDPQAKVQGPFSALEMTEWYRAGYFNENLFVRRVCDARFRPLGELIKICNGQMPFSHSHLIPIDLNPAALTPPLPPVITASTSAQPTEFVIKTLNEHHQQQHHEKLKGNVTAAADSLSNALKSLINSVDISQVLNIHFQTLQDRFIHNKEMEIVSELSKNECFQRLSGAEQDAVVRQKLQMMVLPEYLTNLTGLSNSLAALNPSAGTQLYDTIAECTKKERLFNGGNHQTQTQAQTQQHHQQQQRNIHHGSSSTLYMNAEDFIMKNKNANQDISSNDLLNEFNLRMFLNNGSDAAARVGSRGVASPNSHGHEFLNDQQMFGVGVSGSTATPSVPSNTAQSPMMQMWMNSLAVNQTNSLPSQQLPLVTGVQQPGSGNNQWLNGPLVGIPTISLSRDQHTSGNIMGCSPKPNPTSMWDVATLEQHVQVQQQQQQHHHDQQLHQQLQHQKSFEHQHRLQEGEKTSEDSVQQKQQQGFNKQSHQQQTLEKSNQQEHQQQKPIETQKINDTSTKDFLANDSSNNLSDQQHCHASQQGTTNEKPNQQNKRNSNNNNNNSGAKSPNKPSKNDNNEYNAIKKTEEERRREQNEEKRRQKEERKRQQIEEDKRRVMQAEEEKRRQMQEEEKRQQQIQAQRRKALLSNNNNAKNNGTSNSNQKSNKEQQRIQSSVAPWSTQTMVSKMQGPGLAEIQRAERRERRADQQRQLEIQEKQMRALASAAEVQDTVLKWNAAPVPVKSFAEIQAEEAKRLAHEQMELQRKKEQEALHNMSAFSSGASTAISATLSNPSNVSTIWSGNKIWGTSINMAGFWEEPLKYNNTSIGSSGITANSNNTNNSNISAALIVSQSLNTQKSSTGNIITASVSSQQPTSNRNIKKSQSVAVMQNTASPPTTANVSGSSNNQKKLNNAQTAKVKWTSQKCDSNIVGGNEKKCLTKINNTNTTAATKCDDYETEFVNWCTKSLNNMNTKVDVPTFVSFLRDLESPYEVKDYIRMYLGESKEYIDFAKQFLERRSKYKNLQRAQNAHDDDLCKPAQAITPSVNDNGDNKGKQKKIKKSKMTKLDARILGFSVTAAEGRINVGDRDYGDAP